MDGRQSASGDLRPGAEIGVAVLTRTLKINFGDQEDPTP